MDPLDINVIFPLIFGSTIIGFFKISLIFLTTTSRSALLKLKVKFWSSSSQIEGCKNLKQIKLKIKI